MRYMLEWRSYTKHVKRNTICCYTKAERGSFTIGCEEYEEKWQFERQDAMTADKLDSRSGFLGRNSRRRGVSRTNTRIYNFTLRYLSRLSFP
jgi:hypothetical protein